MTHPAARILDANANRAREAMRMMEDAARFALNDADLASTMKGLRHDLRRILDHLPPGWLEANRDTPGDVGTDITTAAESVRSNLAEVVIAAGKRLTESLRVLEETCKTMAPPLAGQLESLRYRAYTAEAALNARMAVGRNAQWRLCVLLSESLCRQPWKDVLQAAVDHGADCIQVREKSLDDAAQADRAAQVVEIAHAAGAAVIVNDRVDIALAAGADGVHVGTSDLSIAQVRRIAGRSLLVGATTHDLDEAALAVQAGADYCGVGAMFATPLKPHQHPSGIEYLRSFISQFPDTPHLAIGGIDADNLAAVTAAGARGVAVSSCVCAAENPADVVRRLRDVLDANVTTPQPAPPPRRQTVPAHPDDRGG